VTGWLLSPRQEVKEILRSQAELDTSHSLVYHGEISGFDIIKEFIVGRGCNSGAVWKGARCGTTLSKIPLRISRRSWTPLYAVNGDYMLERMDC
jgi:hypothetical protein